MKKQSILNLKRLKAGRPGHFIQYLVKLRTILYFYARIFQDINSQFISLGQYFAYTSEQYSKISTLRSRIAAPPLSLRALYSSTSHRFARNYPVMESEAFQISHHVLWRLRFLLFVCFEWIAVHSLRQKTALAAPHRSERFPSDPSPSSYPEGASRSQRYPLS